MKLEWAWRRWLGAALLMLGAGTSAPAAEAPKFDGRGWTVGNQQRNARESLTEYVLPGQTVDAWKELVTSTVFLRPVPIDALVKQIHQSMSQGCPSLVWNVIQQDQKSAVFEWRDSGCGGFEAQNELDRLTVEKDGLYRLAYAIKVKGPLPAAKKKEWLAILAQVPLAEGSLAASAPSRPAAAVNSQASAPVKKLSTEELAVGVRRSGWTCPAGTKSELKGQTAGPQGPLATWVLVCSNGLEFTVLVDPSGSMTSFQTPK